MVLLLVRKKKHHFESIDSISPLVSKRISKRLEKKKSGQITIRLSLANGTAASAAKSFTTVRTITSGCSHKNSL